MVTNNEHLMQTYNRLPVAFERGEGAWLWDANGNKCLDALAGIAVCGLGHAHPAVTEALCNQAGRLIHTSNLYQVEAQQALADALCARSGMDRVFFANSGAEANEAAIKLARLYGRQRDIDEPAIVVTEGSFHGRTLATLSATGNRKVQAGFEPLVRGFVRVPYDDLAAVENVVRGAANVVAVMVEPVLGEGGIVIPAPGYLAGLRKLCDDHGLVLMLDEIQTGMCRSGKWFAFEHEHAQPDVMTLAKGLGNGVPIGACLARGAAADVLQPGTHGSTFGGNPLACNAALAVVETLAEAALDARAHELGQRMRQQLTAQLEDVAAVQSIRGLGLLLGIELDRPCGEIVTRALEKGVLVNVTATNVVRLLPPLIISDAEADMIVSVVVESIREFLA